MWKTIELTPVDGGTGKIVHSALLHELRDHPRKSKGIRHPQHLAIQTKLTADKALAEQHLPDEGLAPRQVSVTFHPPAAGDLPMTGGNLFFDAGVERRIILLDEFI